MYSFSVVIYENEKRKYSYSYHREEKFNYLSIAFSCFTVYTFALGPIVNVAGILTGKYA